MDLSLLPEIMPGVEAEMSQAIAVWPGVVTPTPGVVHFTRAWESRMKTAVPLDEDHPTFFSEEVKQGSKIPG